jgi:hypothetical protein
VFLTTLHQIVSEDNTARSVGLETFREVRASRKTSAAPSVATSRDVEWRSAGYVAAAAVGVTAALRRGLSVLSTSRISVGAKSALTEMFDIQGVSKRALRRIPNVTVWRMLRKRLHLKTYKLSIFQTIYCSEL